MPDYLPFETKYFSGYSKPIGWRRIVNPRYKIGQRIRFKVVVIPKEGVQENVNGWSFWENYPIGDKPYYYEHLGNFSKVKKWNGIENIEIEIKGKRILSLPGTYSFSIANYSFGVFSDETAFFTTEVISKDARRATVWTVVITTFGMGVLRFVLNMFGITSEKFWRFVLGIFGK